MKTPETPRNKPVKKPNERPKNQKNIKIVNIHNYRPSTTPPTTVSNPYFKPPRALHARMPTHPQPEQESTKPVRKIIIRRNIQPMMDGRMPQQPTIINAEDDAMLNTLFQSIFGDVVKPTQSIIQARLPQPPATAFVPNAFIEEVPKTLEDLLHLVEIMDEKYLKSVGEAKDTKEAKDVKDAVLYNVDLGRLKKIAPALCELRAMVGLEAVKNQIVDIVLYYLQRLEVENVDMLHTIIDGAPGTGKTEIAHIYCKILSGLGILSKGTFRKAKKHDLIGGYLGQTALKTAKVLEEARGGVLFIDEIYSFGNSEGKEGRDIYTKECVDLLMEHMSEHKSDFVLVVAGYKSDIQKFFLTMNDGLERRFPIHLSIEKYSSEEMRLIFLKKAREYQWELAEDAIPRDFFEKNDVYFKHFGGDMETLLSKCKYAHSRNLLADHGKKHRVLCRKDFEDGFALYSANPQVKERSVRPVYLGMYS